MWRPFFFGKPKDVKRSYDSRPSTRSALRGGPINPYSGLGTSIDRNIQTYYRPTSFQARTILETIYRESWAIRRCINLPVDDMTIKWREFDILSDDPIPMQGRPVDEETKLKNLKMYAAKMEEQEREWDIRTLISEALIWAQIYGTSFLVMVTQEAPLNTPLNINELRKGDLRNIVLFDRFQVHVEPYTDINEDPFDRNYGKPDHYTFNLKNGGVNFQKIHHSRCIRFDSEYYNINKHQAYNYRWSQSKIIRLIRAVIDTEIATTGVTNQLGELGMLVMKIAGLKEMLSSAGMPPDPGETTLDELVTNFRDTKSIHKVAVSDKEDDLERLEADLNGVATALDKNFLIMSAASGISFTRFWGLSASGLQSTGEGDRRDHQLNVGSKQSKYLYKPIHEIDPFLARNAGIPRPPKSKFPPINDVDLKEQAEADFLSADALKLIRESGGITVHEMRAALNGKPTFGRLSDDFELDKLGKDMILKPTGQSDSSPARKTSKITKDARSKH